jgi:predicted HTH transcriptional regulator
MKPVQLSAAALANTRGGSVFMGFSDAGQIEDKTVAVISIDEYPIKVYDDRIEFFFKELELIEKYGSGVRRVIDTFIAYGLPEPEFEATQGGMAVTVFNAVNGGVGSEKILRRIGPAKGGHWEVIE